MEVNSTQKKQQALQALNGHIVLMAIIAQAAHPGLVATKAASLLKIMPRWERNWLIVEPCMEVLRCAFLWCVCVCPDRILQFGTRLMATGNRQVQETIMDYHEKVSTTTCLYPTGFCTAPRPPGLTSICARLARQHLSYSFNASSVLG